MCEIRSEESSNRTITTKSGSSLGQLLRIVTSFPGSPSETLFSMYHIVGA